MFLGRLVASGEGVQGYFNCLRVTGIRAWEKKSAGVVNVGGFSISMEAAWFLQVLIIPLIVLSQPLFLENWTSSS